MSLLSGNILCVICIKTNTCIKASELSLNCVQALLAVCLLVELLYSNTQTAYVTHSYPILPRLHHVYKGTQDLTN